MTRRLAKRRIRAAGKPETKAASSPDPTVVLPYELRPQPGRPIVRARFGDRHVDMDAENWYARVRDQRARAFGPIAEELRQADAELRGIKQAWREGSRTATDAKIEAADKRARKFAKVWNRSCEEHPGWTAIMVATRGEVAGLALSQNTIEKLRARARKLGLIPKRHRRRKR